MSTKPGGERTHGSIGHRTACGRPVVQLTIAAETVDITCANCLRVVTDFDHGTTERYGRGCRCRPCKETHNQRTRDFRSGRMRGGKRTPYKETRVGLDSVDDAMTIGSWARDRGYDAAARVYR